MTHDSFAIAESLMDRFEAQKGVSVEVLKNGDAGSIVNQAILTRDNPLADVLYGVDNTFLSRALEAGIFAPYQLRRRSRPCPTRCARPRAGIGSHRSTSATSVSTTTAPYLATPLPHLPGWRTSTAPAYRGMLVVENPATSSPGLGLPARDDRPLWRRTVRLHVA